MELVKVKIFKHGGKTMCKATFRNEGTLITMTKNTDTLGDREKSVKLANDFTEFFKPEIEKLLP